MFPASFARKDCAAVWGITDEAVHEVLGRFCRMSMLDYSIETSSYRLHDLLYEYAGKLVHSVESTDISIKYMEYMQANLSNLLNSASDFHPTEFDPQSHIAFGTGLIKADPDKAIEYYSKLLNNLFTWPWILGDPKMISLAKISCIVLSVAFEKINDKNNAEYWKKQAQVFLTMENQSGVGEKNKRGNPKVD